MRTRIEKNNDHKSETARWIVTPAATVRPCREGPHEKQNQDNQNDGSEGHVYLHWISALNNLESGDMVRTMPCQQPTDKNGAAQSAKQICAGAIADRVNHALDRLVRNPPRRPPQMNEQFVQRRIPGGWKFDHL